MAVNQSSISHTWIATEEIAGMRLDAFLGKQIEIGSRSRGERLIELGCIQVNNRQAKASQRLKEGDRIMAIFPQLRGAELKPLSLDLEILFEDTDLLIVNKPAGLVVHPSAGHADDTLVNALLHHAKDLSMGFTESRPGIVHRIDKETSGLLVVAKNDFTQHGLAEQFRTRTVHRIYWAIVHGSPHLKRGRITSHLARDPRNRLRFASVRSGWDTGPKGKFAATNYQLLEGAQVGISLLECKLETGRTHQIRVHLSEQGWPIVGDRLYGAGSFLSGVRDRGLSQRIQSMNRIALHAAELGFVHPRTGVQLSFCADWPEDLNFLLGALSAT